MVAKKKWNKKTSILPGYDTAEQQGQENVVFLKAIKKKKWGNWEAIITEMNSNDTHLHTNLHTNNRSTYITLEKRYQNLRKCKSMCTAITHPNKAKWNDLYMPTENFEEKGPPLECANNPRKLEEWSQQLNDELDSLQSLHIECMTLIEEIDVAKENVRHATSLRGSPEVIIFMHKI